jgi:hypothetical protein
MWRGSDFEEEEEETRMQFEKATKPRTIITITQQHSLPHF